MAARRAVIRWSWRLFRREWRQQLLVLLLLTTTVTAAVVGAASARRLVPDPAAEFGSATHRLQVGGADAAELEHALDELRGWFGEIDVIRSRTVTIPGSVESIEVRSQDPQGPLGAPRLALIAGRFPASTTEVAVTDELAGTLDAPLGDTVDVGGTDARVVGLVENPADLDDEFVLGPPDDPRARTAAVLVRATDDRIRSLPGQVHLEVVSERGQDETTVAAVAALGVAVLVAILVCLVAAAGFVVLAHRRLRQLGMLAALGATERHLRLVVVANGVAVGACSAVVGAALAWPVWIGLAPVLEGPAGHRIDRFDLPPWIVASGMALAVVTATAAAWWPGRSISRVPVTQALSARPPRPHRVHRSALLGLGLIVAGFAGLAGGLDQAQEEANALLVLPGIGALVIGVLLTSPIAISVLAASGGRAPIAVRLALRDLARHQARSGVALAAIALSLGLAVTATVLAATNEDGPTEGNLSDRQVLVRLGGADPAVEAVTSPELAARRAAVDRFASRIDGDVLALEAAVSPGVTEQRDGVGYRPVVVLGRPVGGGLRDIDRLYVATPAVLRHLHLDTARFRSTTDVLTGFDGALGFANSSERAAPVVEHIDAPPYTSGPTSLLLPAALGRHGWVAAPEGWLIETARPLTPDQVVAARAMAADAGLTVETRDDQEELTTVRIWSTLIGIGLVLAILTMTVGMIRAESAGDLRILAATGAPTSARRGTVAATAGALAVLGVVLGTGGAYLALVAGYLEDLHPLADPPVADLLLTAIGVPVLAAGAGWLLGGREPTALARPTMD